jgi:hypothetical protein
MSAVRPTKAAKRLIEVAEQLGYSARQTAKGHYRFAHPNGSLIFAGGKEQINRGRRNALAMLRRAAKETRPPDSGQRTGLQSHNLKEITKCLAQATN